MQAAELKKLPNRFAPFIPWLIAAVSAGALAVSVAVDQRGNTVNNFDHVGGDVIVQTPGQMSALDICLHPDTRVGLVAAPVGAGAGPAVHYEAKLSTPEVRYDLTWQVDGDTVAIEELRGADLRFRAEQIGPDFWACAESKAVEVVP